MCWCRAGKVHKAAQNALQVAKWKMFTVRILTNCFPFSCFFYYPSNETFKSWCNWGFLPEEARPCRQSVLRSSCLGAIKLSFSPQMRHLGDPGSPALTVTALTNCSLQLLLPTTRARFVFLISLSTVLCGRTQE